MNDMGPADDAKREDQRFLSSVARALSIFDALASNVGGLTLTGLSRATGISIPSLQRMTKALQDQGYLKRDDRSKKFTAAIKTIDLLHGYLATNALAKTAWPHLVHLREVTDLGVAFGVPRGRAIIYVHRLPSYRGEFENTLPGKEIPIQYSAIGRCVLGSSKPEEIEEFMGRVELTALTPRSVTAPRRLAEEIEKARRQGYCIIDQEVQTGLTTVAAPICKAGTAIGGVSINAPSAVWSAKRLVAEIVPSLLQTVRALRIG